MEKDIHGTIATSTKSVKILVSATSKYGNVASIPVPLMLPDRAGMTLETFNAGIGEGLVDRATVTQNVTYYIEDKAPGWLATFAKAARPDGSYSRTKFEDIKKRLRSLFVWVQKQVILYETDNNLPDFMTKDGLKKAFPNMEQNEFETFMKRYNDNGDNGLDSSEFYKLFGLRLKHTTAW